MSSWQEETVKGYEAFKQRIDALKKKHDRLFVLFTGSPNENGASWCPDCVEFEALFHSFKNRSNLRGYLLIVEVGNREEWKSKDTPFRTDPKLKLTSIPTIMQWGGPRKLSNSDILTESILSLLLNEED